MTLTADFLDDTIAGVGLSETPEGLLALRQRANAAVVWHRHPLDSFQDWINRLDPDHLPNARVTLRPSDVRTAVASICATSGMPSGVERRRFIDDVAALADLFASLTEASYLRLRLDVIDTNACRRFHIDRVRARLICTYRGTGTQYGISTRGADPDPIFTVPTGSPIVLRGTLWPETPPSGLRHRSPPIEGTDEVRLVLVLDAVHDGVVDPVMDPETAT